jgi:predicted DCC family thiol-disulfide oxidoreductase YuxK
VSNDAFVYDDDCGFCTWWADYFVDRTALEPVAFSALTDDQLDRLPEDYEECAHLLTDDAVYSCGAAIERAMARAEVPPGSDDVFGFLRQFSDYQQGRERLYRAVADRRDTWGQFLSKDDVDHGR